MKHNLELVEVAPGQYVNPSAVRCILPVARYDSETGKFTNEVDGYCISLGDGNDIDVVGQTIEAILWKLTGDPKLLRRPVITVNEQDYSEKSGEILRGVVRDHRGWNPAGTENVVEGCVERYGPADHHANWWRVDDRHPGKVENPVVSKYHELPCTLAWSDWKLSKETVPETIRVKASSGTGERVLAGWTADKG